MRRVIITLAATAAIIVGGILSPASATAFIKYAYQGSDFAYADLGYNCSTNNSAHHCYQHYALVGVSDHESDGHRVKVDYVDNTGNADSFADTSGNNGIGRALNLHTAYSTPRWIDKFRVCEANGTGGTGGYSCSGWLSPGGFWVEAA